MGKSWEPYLVFIQTLLTETNSQGQSKHWERLRPSPTVINNELSINCDSQLTVGEKQQWMLLVILLPEWLYEKRFTSYLIKLAPSKIPPLTAGAGSLNEELLIHERVNKIGNGKKKPTAQVLMKTQFPLTGGTVAVKKNKRILRNTVASIPPWWTIEYLIPSTCYHTFPWRDLFLHSFSFMLILHGRKLRKSNSLTASYSKPATLKKTWDFDPKFHITPCKYG